MRTRAPGRAGVGGDGPGGLDAVEDRHPDVHQDHVGVVLPDQGDGLRRRPPASPSTFMSGAAATMTAKPPRTSAWSSAITTLIVIAACRWPEVVGGHGQSVCEAGLDAEPARVRPGVQLAAEQGGPFPHPDQAVTAAGAAIRRVRGHWPSRGPSSVTSMLTSSGR